MTINGVYTFVNNIPVVFSPQHLSHEHRSADVYVDTFTFL